MRAVLNESGPIRTSILVWLGQLIYDNNLRSILSPKTISIASQRIISSFGTQSCCHSCLADWQTILVSLSIRPSAKPQEKLTLPLAKNTTRRVPVPVCVSACMTTAIRGWPVPPCIAILVTRKSAQSRNWHSWYVPSRTALQRNAFNYRNRNAWGPRAAQHTEIFNFYFMAHCLFDCPTRI